MKQLLVFIICCYFFLQIDSVDVLISQLSSSLATSQSNLAKVNETVLNNTQEVGLIEYSTSTPPLLLPSPPLHFPPPPFLHFSFPVLPSRSPPQTSSLIVSLRLRSKDGRFHIL